MLSAVVCGALFALPSSAFGGTVFNDLDSPSFASNAGETNNVTVAASPGGITFSDATTPVTTADCTQVNPNTVTCTPPPGSTGFSDYGVFAGDLNDSITANGPLGGSLLGDEGNDSVVGSNENSATTDPTTGLALGGNEFLDGGPGTDPVQGRGGDDSGRGGDNAGGTLNDDGDQVDLGPGDDFTSVSGPSDGVNDSYQGGPGIDFVSANNSSPGPPATPFDAFTCEAARLTVQEYVGVKRSGKLVTTSKVGDLILAEKTVKLGKLVNTVKLKASKRLGKRLPKRFKAKIRVTAQDEFGNRSVVTKRVVVKNKKKSKKRRKKSRR